MGAKNQPFQKDSKKQNYCQNHRKTDRQRIFKIKHLLQLPAG